MFKTQRYFWWIAIGLFTITIMAASCSNNNTAPTTIPTAPATETTATLSNTNPPTVSATPLNNETWTPTPSLTATEPVSTTTISPAITPITLSPTNTTTLLPTTTTTPTTITSTTSTTTPTTTTPTTTPTPNPTPQPGAISIGAPATASVGSTFVVNVNIGQIMDLSGYQFEITYNNSLIRLTPDDEGGAGATNGNIISTVIPINWAYDPSGVPGRLRLTGGTPNQPVTGSGYLAQLHFIVVGTAGKNSTLTISPIEISPGQPSAYCYDSNGDKIAVSIQNGSVSIVP